MIIFFAVVPLKKKKTKFFLVLWVLYADERWIDFVSCWYSGSENFVPNIYSYRVALIFRHFYSYRIRRRFWEPFVFTEAIIFSDIFSLTWSSIVDRALRYFACFVFFSPVSMSVCKKQLVKIFSQVLYFNGLVW